MKTTMGSLELPKLSPDPFVVELDISGIAPESLFPRLTPTTHEALLVSGGDHPLSQHSFIGLDPFLVVTAYGRNILVEQHPRRKQHSIEAEPFETLRHLLQFYRQEPRPGFPPFWSGGIGYLSYELGRHLEKLPATTEEDLGLPELYLVFYRAILCYSHRSLTYTLYGFDLQEEKCSPNESLENRLCKRILKAKDGTTQEGCHRLSTLPLNLQSHFSRERYLDAVLRVLNYIREGDIYQVNLSQRFYTPYNGDPYGLFLKLFRINPAPFFAFLNTGPFQIISSSPERFLFLDTKNRIETRPIKGTSPRGSTTDRDLANSRGLLKSEKNRAELAMITDLLRNDLGRISDYGSVAVEETAMLEAYTNVFHLVSIVSGILAPNKDRIDLLRATFPGGSITGCPKIRSMEIIDELEPTVRSVYTGSIGYLGWDGAMDLNIAIRTLILKNQELYYQVGGGIVYDSDPEAEYEETLHKAASMNQALIATC